MVGSGFEPLLDDVVEIVNLYETGRNCTCDNEESLAIVNRAKLLTTNLFNMVCGLTESSAIVVNDAWANIKPRNCYYTFYISYP